MASDGPAYRYAQDLEKPGFERDPAQATAVDALQDVYRDLVNHPPRGILRKRWPRVTGLYIWGGVGRGKTYLMDRFYESLPFTAKRRTHFHRFMREVHDARRAYKDRRDPLRLVAREQARDRVLCFDEFYVSDIADAMILGRLTSVLFELGVTLIATSNVHPDDLYKDGLQRDRFLPAIDRLKRNCRVVELAGETDYRLRVLERAEIYHHPLDAQADANLAEYFEEIAPDAGRTGTALRINGRDIPARRLSDGVAHFDFDALCRGPRAAADYAEIACEFHTVLLADVPQLDDGDNEAARRLINLVDEFYDRRVKLIVSAEVPAESLYAGDRLAFEYRRTASRLREMASHDYLALGHRP